MDMVKNTILLLVLSVGLNAAPDDIILSQAKNPGPGNIQRNLAPVANAAIGVDANKVPVALNAFTQNSATGAVTIAAQGTNQNVTIQPSGTGNITLGGTTGGVRIPSTNTAGLQLYNTVDQVTNYERLEALWSGNTGTIRTTKGGSGSDRTMLLQAAGITNIFIRPMLSSSGRIELQSSSSSAANEVYFKFTTGTNSATSGTTTGLSITPTYNQASGTASNTDFLINRTQTAVGSGAQLLIDAQVGGTSQFSVSNNGRISVKQASNGSAGTFTLSSGSATVNNTSVTADSVIVFTIKTSSGTPGATRVSATSVGTSFTITGAAGDNSTYNYIILNATP